MNFKSYATKKDTPQRMARKHARASTFLHNSKLAKATRKARRLARKSHETKEIE